MADENQETKLCLNCKRNISAANFVMHEVHCRRHISLCEHCQEPVPRSELEQHFEENHAKISCPKCGEQVEKNLLENHEEESCSKRQMKCHYCEMEVPRSDFESHSDYCGTRTEACVKCGQFIMIKDQLKHDDSNCTYPTPKPTNGNTGASSAVSEDDLLFGSGDVGMDPFVFDEMKRIWTNMSGASGNVNLERPKLTVNQRVQNKNIPPTGSRKEKNQVIKNKSNKKSDLNRQREVSVSKKDSSSNVEHDRLLAMHLAQDLNKEQDMDSLIHSFDKLPYPGYEPRPSPDSPAFPDIETDFADSSNLNNFDGMSMSMLPCEFCGEAMPSDLLVEHQSSCVADPLSSLMPQNAASSHDRANANIQQADNRYSRIAQETRPNPPFIDNLGPGLDWTNTSSYDGASSEDFMLPCEFCDELFPMDVLVQHQAICEANGTVTPRVTTPAVQRSAQRHQEELPNSRSKRRQPEPDINAILANNSDIRSPSGASWNSHSDITPQQELRSTMHKYGVSPGEPVISKKSQQKILEHLVKEKEKENQQRNSSRKTSLPSSKRIDSAARTRNTLDQLINDDIPSSPSHDLLGHLNVTSNTAKKYNKDNFNAKQKQLPTNLSSSVTRVVPGARGGTRSSRTTGVSARDVHRELEQYDTQQQDVNSTRKSTRPTRTSRSSVPSSADRPPLSTSTTNGASRQRIRNNIFDNGNRNTASKPSRRNSDDFQ